MKRLLFLVLALGVACASLPAKQVISGAHLAARGAVTALDDAETALCQPDATKKHCTAAGESDAVHNDFSARIITFYQKDKAISQLIVAWQPGTPAPADLTSAVTMAENFLKDARQAWQPMETAPKDRDILAVGGVVKWPRVLRWCDAPGFHGWFSLGGENELFPTHWMPLPDPPKAEERT